MVPVTLYSTYGKESIKYIINHAELEVIFTAQKNISLLSEVRNECPTLKKIIFVGEKSELEGNDLGNMEVIIYSDLIKKGGENIVEPANTKGDELGLIIYTSGTTGNPKGVVHIHSSLVAMIAGNVNLIPFTPSDFHLAFLPMAHIMEQFVEGLVVAVGGGIGFWSGGLCLGAIYSFFFFLFSNTYYLFEFFQISNF